MKSFGKVFSALLVCAPHLANACTVCMGDPNSNVAKGANAAIFVMLGLLAGVFGLIGLFAYMLYRRSKQPTPPHAELSGIIDAHPDAGFR